MLAVAFLAASCTPTTPSPDGPPEATTGIAPQQQPSSAHTENTLSAPPTADKSIDAPSETRPQTATRPPPEPINAPHRLAGFSGEALGELLGPPLFKRHDAPAEVWQYGGADCLLDVFLYRDENAGDLTVAHSEARTRDGTGMERRNCLTSLIKKRRQGDSG